MILNRIFLLGGSDLEMKTISGLLAEKGLLYVNHGLRWHNAYVSSYREELEYYGSMPSWKIYGVELQEDISLPPNYICIDHHTYNSGKPSSLEQVANLLEYKLNHYQQLVAINDVSYISGMYEAGASDEEVNRIRFEDRRAQGVTDEEEKLAVLSIQDNKKEIDDLVIVRSYTSCFSPICDRLYPYRKLLIYTDRELTYYGDGVMKLVDLFQSDIQGKRVFYGGGPKGYLGVARDSFTSQEILQLVDKIKTII